MVEQNSRSIRALYPGTFDPPTLGHISLIERACSLFGDVTVAVAKISGKDPLLMYEQRINLLEQIFSGDPKVKIIGFTGLLVDCAKKTNSNVIVRGLRTISDFDVEYRMSTINNVVMPELETVFLMSEPEYSFISSTFVKQIAREGGDISAFVPSVVLELLKELEENGHNI